MSTKLLDDYFAGRIFGRELTEMEKKLEKIWMEISDESMRKYAERKDFLICVKKVALITEVISRYNDTKGESYSDGEDLLEDENGEWDEKAAEEKWEFKRELLEEVKKYVELNDGEIDYFFLNEIMYNEITSNGKSDSEIIDLLNSVIFAENKYESVNSIYFQTVGEGETIAVVNLCGGYGTNVIYFQYGNLLIVAGIVNDSDGPIYQLTYGDYGDYDEEPGWEEEYGEIIPFTNFNASSPQSCIESLKVAIGIKMARELLKEKNLDKLIALVDITPPGVLEYVLFVSRDPEIIQRLLERKPELDIEFAEKLILTAISEGREEISRVLIENDVGLFVENDEGFIRKFSEEAAKMGLDYRKPTPLDYAKFTGMTKIVELIREKTEESEEESEGGDAKT